MGSAALRAEEQPAKSGDDSLEMRQRGDLELAQVVTHLETGVLLEGHKRARELALTRSQYTITDGVLHHVEKDKTLQIIPPRSDREKILKEAHSGTFGGHLGEVKVHGQLAKHYWWPKMRGDITTWCHACLTCASRLIGWAVKPALTPIPVSGTFDKLLDAIQFPKSFNGNQYVVVFVDYLTKWPEVFATPDQTSLTIARLLVEHVVCRHGVPVELLSDRGKAFLSKLMHEVYQLMGIQKTKTTAYHPQIDSLVECFNRTLTDMLAKTVETHGHEWDERLPYVLFAYRTSLQEFTKESLFFLLYGRHPRLTTEQEISLQPSQREQVQKAKRRQKHQHDRHARDPGFNVGDRVFVYMPALRSGKAYKFAKLLRVHAVLLQ